MISELVPALKSQLIMRLNRATTLFVFLCNSPNETPHSASKASKTWRGGEREGAESPGTSVTILRKIRVSVDMIISIYRILRTATSSIHTNGKDVYIMGNS